MFGIGMPEMLLILAIALIVFGPKKLPELAKSLGRAFGEFRRATAELKNSIDLDDDLKEVKQTIQDIDRDVSGSGGAQDTSVSPETDSLQGTSADSESARAADASAGKSEPQPDDAAAKAKEKKVNDASALKGASDNERG